MKKYFITGLVILLPVAITVAIVVFLIHFFTEPFVHFVSDIIYKWNVFPNGALFVTQENFIQYVSRILILLMLLGVTLLLGVLARGFFIHSFFSICDKVVHKIPLINTVYKTSQDIIKTIFTSDKNSFKQVVMVPYPRPGVFILGLIARESPPACCSASGEDLISVFVPTTPNPTTGFLLMYKKEEIVNVDMKPEDAVKYIVSCGVILPEQQRPLRTQP